MNRWRKLVRLPGLKQLSLLIVMGAIVVSLGCASAPQQPAEPAQGQQAKPAPEKPTKPAEVPQWNVIAGAEGSSNLAFASGAFPLLNKWAGTVTLLPVAGSPVSAIRNLAKDPNIHGIFGSQTTLQELWTDTGEFAKNPVKGTKVYQSIYHLQSAFFLIARADSGIKSYDDLAGKRISLGDAKWAFPPKVQEALDAIGLKGKVTNKFMAGDELPEALKTGSVQAVLVTVASNNSIPAWVQQIMVANGDVVALKTTEAQNKAMGTIDGMAFTFTSPNPFGQDMGVDKIPGIAWFPGLHFVEGTDPAIVYSLTKALIENRKELSALGKSIATFIEGEGWKELATTAISSARNAPVHPGVAKYYKEAGIWQSGWKEGK